LKISRVWTLARQNYPFQRQLFLDWTPICLGLDLLPTSPEKHRGETAPNSKLRNLEESTRWVENSEICGL